jgi:hypothetical protein
MNPDDLSQARLEQLLEENLELARENNELLRDMRRMGRISFWGKLLLWGAVIILPFIFLKPYLEALVPAASGDTNGVFGFPSKDQLEKALDSYQNGY